MSCCLARFDSPEDRQAVVNSQAVNTWRMRERMAGRPSTEADFFAAHDVCSVCRGSGERFVRVAMAAVSYRPVYEPCRRCSGDGYHREAAA